MIADDRTDTALCELYTAVAQYYAHEPVIKAEGAIAVNRLLLQTALRIESLRPYHTAWRVGCESCRLWLIIEFQGVALPDELRELTLLGAIGFVILDALGLREWEIVGCDGKGLRIMRHEGAWVAEAVA